VDLCIRKVQERLQAEAGSFKNADGLLRGQGIACAVKAPAMPNDAASSVVLKFCEDATLEVLVSGTDIGQGLLTVAAQFAAEALDLPVEKVRVRGQPDTDLSPYDWQTVASRQTWATGNAIVRAAAKIKDQLFDVASEVLGADRGRLAIRDLAVVDTKTGKSIPLTRLVMGYQYEDGHAIGGPVAAHDSYMPERRTTPTCPRACCSSIRRPARARSRWPSGPSAPRGWRSAWIPRPGNTGSTGWWPATTSAG
jgi:carbon-monoxide dehydrogenase large subunit